MQNFSSFESYLKLSNDCKKLIIVNRKPIENPEFILDADPNVIQKKREEYLKNRDDLTQTMPNEFSESRSSGTCYLSDIDGFIYGASHS